MRERGHGHFRAGKWDSADAEYKECVEVLESGGPTREWGDKASEVSTMCLLNRGLCKLKLKEWEEAVRLCSMVLKVKEGNPKALYRRAQALMQLQEYDRAKDDISELERVSKEDEALAKRLMVDWHKGKDALKVKESKIFKKMFS